MPIAPSTDHRSSRRALRPGLLTIAALALSACTMTSGPGPTAPNFFQARLTQTGLTGSYDPSGFDATAVQKALAQACAIPTSLVDYREQPVNGRMAFSARCWGGTNVLLGTISVYRYGNRARVTLPGFAVRGNESDRYRTIPL